HLQQREAGLPVWHASAFVALGDDGYVIATGSSFFPAPESGIARASISGEDALASSASDLGAVIRTDRPTESALWLVPVPGDGEWTLAPAWQTQFESEEPFGVWESLVHANTGEILSRQNAICTVDVVGNVDGMTQDFSYCDGVTNRPMRNVRVNVSGGSNDLTDENGDFVIPNAGGTPVTVTAALNGQNFNVNRFSGLGADASFSGSATPGNPLQITWSTSNARQDEIDVYFHAERAHQFMIDIDTAFDTVNLPHPMIATVGRTDNICPGNAWYSPTGRNINFCAASGSWANTGELGNVIYHEYGHGVSEEIYAHFGINLPSGDLHEGNSDVIANFIDRTSIVGIGFTNCSAGIRNADNDLQWPSDNDGGHFGGQIIAGFYWDSWQEMLAALPQSEADQAAWDGWHFARWLGQPLNQQDEVTWTFLADDDDSNLDNGTPHHEYFRVGADNHNFSWPAITVGVFINHQKLGHTTDGSLGFDVVADIQGVGVTLDPSSPTVFYRVNDGSWQSLAMAATGTPNEFSAHIPEQSNFAEIDYYVYAADTNANETTSPDNAPSVFHSFDVVFDYDGGESGPGLWTAGVAGDTATKGIWDLVAPVATLAQPGDQTTPGGTLAWITGQCGPPNCTGSCVMPQENGCNDVDNGVTSLL
ncbi:MAG: hypothetical protein KC591_17605, partial [Gemmatimonadetes bacterium]|nr:hypothetical protein [Gemmatimonadota bacterium]